MGGTVIKIHTHTQLFMYVYTYGKTVIFFGVSCLKLTWVRQRFVLLCRIHIFRAVLDANGTKSNTKGSLVLDFKDVKRVLELVKVSSSIVGDSFRAQQHHLVLKLEAIPYNEGRNLLNGD